MQDEKRTRRTTGGPQLEGETQGERTESQTLFETRGDGMQEGYRVTGLGRQDTERQGSGKEDKRPPHR